MFLTSFDSVLRIFGVGIFAYLGLIVMLKISGNRTLSQMNTFDFIITIAMGSTFSSGLLDKKVPLFETLSALFLLISMQYILTKLSVKSKSMNALIRSEPVILFYKGKFLKDLMDKERVTEQEVLAAMRESGLSTLDQVEGVVLETNGHLAAIPKNISGMTVLDGVKSFKDVSGLEDQLKS